MLVLSMRLLRKIQKTTLVTLLIFQLFVANIAPASAGLFSGVKIKIPTPSQVASELERRYNLNLGSLQDQGQFLNVADNKKPAPEVSLFFSPSDPKEGQKITAKAFPLYFSNTEESLYYTWTLKHSGCDLTNSPSKDVRVACDRNDDGRITIEDWKIEAMQILAQNGYEGPPSAASADDDGYRARFGGANKSNTPDHCYVNDPDSGTNYELADSSDSSFTCPSGTSPQCMVGEGTVASGANNDGASFFDVADSDTCYVSGTPTCSAGTPTCQVGTARCVADLNSCGTALTACSTTTASGASPQCTHLFPEVARSGDGSFGTSEEEFWGTDPNDPDTADNGNKDEANIVGLGRSSFTWNYVAGDEVGVAVEGTSMIPTKHDDSSYMIMWAFSKKDCPLSLASGTGAYTKSIKGYSVSIPTADFDLNECIERNLVDPTRGGQATNMEVTVNATPENPLNDETSDKGGDSIRAQASIANPQGNLSTTFFDWDVDISDNVQFRSGDGADTARVTGDLQTLGLLGNVKGNALDSIDMGLNIQSGTTLGGRPIASYLNGGVGYLRFTARVTENFSPGFTRKGRSDVIVKFTSSGKKISAYKATAALIGSTMKVSLPAGSEAICKNDILDRAACRVVKNEIIGLKVDDTDLSNFKWTINGSPLTCSRANVSNNCDDEPNEVNFFPVAGNIGDVYTVSVTANDVLTGNVVTLGRTFHIVEPLVILQSLDENTAWQKYLGQYKDLTGQATQNCPGGWCMDYSTSMFEGFSGSTLKFSAKFIPGFLGGNASTREWRVDGELVSEDASGAIAFPAIKPAPGIYTISLIAEVLQSDNTRRALLDIWGISPFESTEINLATTAQVALQEPGIITGPLQGERKYLAALISYVPASVLFTFRILLSALLILFMTHFLYTLLQDRRMKGFVASIPKERA